MHPSLKQTNDIITR